MSDRKERTTLSNVGGIAKHRMNGLEIDYDIASGMIINDIYPKGRGLVDL
jgi:hypothetical protein